MHWKVSRFSRKIIWKVTTAMERHNWPLPQTHPHTHIISMTKEKTDLSKIKENTKSQTAYWTPHCHNQTRQITILFLNKEHSNTYLNIFFKSNTVLYCNNHLLKAEEVLKYTRQNPPPAKPTGLKHTRAHQGYTVSSLFLRPLWVDLIFYSLLCYNDSWNNTNSHDMTNHCAAAGSSPLQNHVVTEAFTCKGEKRGRQTSITPYDDRTTTNKCHYIKLISILHTIWFSVPFYFKNVDFLWC